MPAPLNLALERIRVHLNSPFHFQAGLRSVFRAMHSSAPSSIRFTMALRANALRRALSRTMSPAIAGDHSRSSRPCHCEAGDNNDSQRGPPPQVELAVSQRGLPALSNACRT